MRGICYILFLLLLGECLFAQAKIALLISASKSEATTLIQKDGTKKQLKEGMIVQKGDKIILPKKVCLYIEYQGEWKLRKTFIGPKTIVIQEKKKEVKKTEEKILARSRGENKEKIISVVSRYGDKWAKRPLLEWVRSRGDQLLLSYPRLFIRNKNKLVFSWLPVKGNPVYLLNIQSLDDEVLLEAKTKESQFVVTSSKVLHNPRGFIWSVHIEGDPKMYPSVRVYKHSSKREKKLQKIEQRLQEAIAENPQDLGVWWTLYHSYYRWGLYQEAMDTYREITTRFVQDPTLTLPILFKICVELKMDRELIQQFSGFDFCEILQQYLQEPNLDPAIRQKLMQELKNSELDCSWEKEGDEEK